MSDPREVDRSAHSKRLYVYECRGAGLPRREPVHPHFLGIWSEPPHYYYLFFSEPVLPFVTEWSRGEPGWHLEGHYDLDYSQWQQLPDANQVVGPFVISLSGPCARSTAERPAEDGLLITLDPGLVFGSGLHPTTRGSLLAISHWLAAGRAQTALDFGTGTGILALACAACGAKRVLAVDCNPLAVRAALKNAARNRLEDRITGIAANSLGAISFPQDLLVMNIEWPSLLQVLQEGLWTQHTAIIASGYLKHQEGEVMTRFSRPGSHRLAWRHEEDGWPTLIFASETGLPGTLPAADGRSGLETRTATR